MTRRFPAPGWPLPALLFAGLIATAWTSSHAQVRIAGDGDQIFSVRGWGGPPILVRAHRPPGVPATARTVIALHGVERNGERTFETWRRLADEYGFIAIIPEFSARRFPGETYAQGRALPSGASSFDAVEPIFSTARRRLKLTGNRYSLFGHSAGAQFVHRFILLHPEARWDHAVVANAGWYTMPTSLEPWPYGLGGTGARTADLRALLGKSVIIELGDADTNPYAENLEHNLWVDRQGINRLQRGFTFYTSARDLAKREGVPFRWRLAVIPGLGHDSVRAAEVAAAADHMGS